MKGTDSDLTLFYKLEFYVCSNILSVILFSDEINNCHFIDINQDIYSLIKQHDQQIITSVIIAFVT